MDCKAIDPMRRGVNLVDGILLPMISPLGRTRQLTSRRTEQATLNRQLIAKFVEGKLLQEDFDTLKQSITAELASIDALCSYTLTHG
jgi:hypothetical protein